MKESYSIARVLSCFDFDTGCEELTLGNGLITYSSGVEYNSVATFSCDVQYGLFGLGNTPTTSNTRRCTENGWSGFDLFCQS